MRRLLPALVLLAACGTTPSRPAADTTSTDVPDTTTADTTADTTTLPFTFPKGFLWGSAVAGFQVDMGCPTLPPEQCEDRQSDWYQWVTDPALQKSDTTFLSGQPVSVGPGMWELWPQDLDLAADDLHNNAIRLSIEWSRLFPDAKAESAQTVAELAIHADQAAVAHYHALFQGARQRKLQLLVTLNHYTLPLWLHDGKDCHLNGLESCKDRGWVDKDRILKAIALYAGFCAQEFGAEVDLWGTLNEPFAVVLAGYMLPSKERTNPPGVTLEVDTAIQVAFNMMEAHARMYDAVHAEDAVDADGDGKKARVGLVANLAAVAPADPAKAADVAVVAHCDYIYHRVFLNAIVQGELDRNLDGKAEETRPDMKDRLDFLGINYYTRLLVKAQAAPLFPQYPLFDFMPDTSILFNDYPAGLYEVINLGAEYGRPMIITENGTGGDKAKAWDAFVRPHLEAVHEAIAEGKQVEGYFYWTLMDNYEWNHGMTIKMGLYGLDPVTKARIPTALSQAYGKAAQANGF